MIYAQLAVVVGLLVAVGSFGSLAVTAARGRRPRPLALLAPLALAAAGIVATSIGAFAVGREMPVRIERPVTSQGGHTYSPLLEGTI